MYGSRAWEGGLGLGWTAVPPVVYPLVPVVAPSMVVELGFVMNRVRMVVMSVMGVMVRSLTIVLPMKTGLGARL